jgi:hypothetical protein
MSEKKKSSGRGSAPKGDREPGLTPPIPFVSAKMDESDEPRMVDITIKKNPSKKATKDNTEKKQFSAIETFTGNRASVVIVLKNKLQTEIFEHLGITHVNKKVDEQLDYLLQITTSHAQDQLVNIFKQGRRQFANAFAISKHQKDAFVQDNKVFFEWLVKGDKEDIPKQTQMTLSKTADEHCQQYEAYVWFEMGKLLWIRHKTVFDEHIGYLENKIIKPYDMAIRDF